MVLLENIQHYDENATRWIEQRYQPWLNSIMIFLTRIAEKGACWFTLSVFCMITNSYRMMGYAILIGLSVAHIWSEFIIKSLVKRTRPFIKMKGIELIKRPSFYSFPSSHSASAFAVVGIACRMAPLIFLVGIGILAVGIAFSRFYLRVHYVTDVICGSMVGFISGIASVSILYQF